MANRFTGWEMFRLVAFGNAALERDGKRLDGLSGQRKAIALLALLAVAGERGLSRDRLMATLWPESDETRARGALKQLVHAIRQQIGAPELLVGAADVRLNAECIRSDVDEFETALRVGDTERAISLYAGPFLDGFHLRDAAEFDRWAEGERTGYARRFAEALETLARTATATGDHVGAVKLWGRLAANAPLDARIAMQLMSSLADAGDQAAALRHGHTYEALVRDELDSPPDPGIAARMATLRAAPAPYGPLSTPDAPVRATMPLVPSASAEFAADVPPVVPPVDGSSVRSGDRRRRTVLFSVAALVILVSGGAYLLRRSRTDHGREHSAATSARVPVAQPSVGVLPFSNTSGHPEDEHFSDGLTDELIGALGKVNGLKVAGRTSAFALKGRRLGIRAVADTLHVGAVLEGSVRRAGDRLRVSAQLVASANDSVLWAETYDRKLVDIFAVQEEIAQAIVHALRVKLGGSTAPLVSRRTMDPAAYELYLKGRYFSSRPSREGLDRAISYFEQAITRDSTYSSPYAGLADAHILRVLFAGRSPRDELPRARAAAAKALALDGTLGEARAALAHVLFAFDWDWSAAGREYVRAIALDPGSATVRQRYGIFLLDQRRFDDAVVQLIEARRIDPLSATVTMTLGRVYVSRLRPDQAVPLLHAALELNPTLAFAHQQLGHAYLQQRKNDAAILAFQRAAELSGSGDSAQLAYAYAVSNRRKEARVILERLLASSSSRYLPPFAIAMAFAGLGETDPALTWLERGYEERAAYMDMLDVAPAFEPLHADPRYGALLRRMRLDSANARSRDR